jgi:hypothetical protein
MEKEPSAHVWHVLLAAPRAVENVPVGHREQERSSRGTFSIWKVPAGQKVQLLALSLEYDPGMQVSHVLKRGLEKVPAMQIWHCFDPLPENVPPGQLRQSLMLELPSWLAYVPPGHIWHELSATVSLYNPWSHLMQPDVTLPAYPAAQRQSDKDLAPGADHALVVHCTWSPLKKQCQKQLQKQKTKQLQKPETAAKTKNKKGLT